MGHTTLRIRLSRMIMISMMRKKKISKRVKRRRIKRRLKRTNKLMNLLGLVNQSMTLKNALKTTKIGRKSMNPTIHSKKGILKC